jgi:hypothetical protein
MRRFIDITFALLIGIICLCIPSVATCQSAVLMHHNDLGQTGQNLAETILNTSNVNVASFGKLFARPVDGFMYAQPLYVPDLTIKGSTHNVVFVATEHNSVYAFDADDPNAATPLWQVNLGTSVPSNDICVIDPTGDCPYTDLIPEIGITSTPVIDTASNSGTMYVVAKTKNTANNTYHFSLHALDITSGAEKFAGPVEIVGQVAGTGTGSSNGTVTFYALHHTNRPGLLLLNGVVYLAFGSVGDIGIYHGWIFAYDAATLQRTVVLNIAPNGEDAGIWQDGQSLLGDAAGDVYAITANGTFDAASGGVDYGDTFLKLSPSPNMSVLDYFTPGNQVSLDINNTDLGSGGPTAIPGTTLIIGGGKDGIMRVVDTANMGKFHASDNNVQEFQLSPNASTLGFGSPIYWDSPNHGPVIYVWGAGDTLKAFAFNGKTFQTSPVMQSSVQGAPGYSNLNPLSLSANGSQAGTGIVWASGAVSGNAEGQTVTGILHAFDATDLSKELWNSKQNVVRDDVGNFAKFTPPTIANGKVYQASFSGQMLAYGLNPPALGGIQFIQVAAATPQSPTQIVAASYPGAQTAGDLNIVVVGWNDTTATVQSITDSRGNPYTLAIGPTSGAGVRQAIYYAKKIASGSNTVTVTFNQPANFPDVRILEYSGLDPASPLDVAAGTSGNSTTSDSGPVTTTAANELIFGANCVATGTSGAGTIFTSRIITNPDSDIAEDRTVSAVGTYNATAPLTSKGNWVMQVATFKATQGTITSPTVSSVAPTHGPITGGTAVTITGTNFVSGATVSFGGSAATGVTYVSSTSITATTPSHAAGTVNVAVTNPDSQSGALSNGFSYDPPPSIVTVTPSSGLTSGGTSVVITGSNFVSGATVSFGGSPATSVSFVSSTSLTATTPSHAAGTVNVAVTNPDSQSGTLTNGFTYTTSVAIRFVQVAAATPQSPTQTVTVDYPTPQTAGDLNIVVVGWNDTTANVQSVRDSLGNVYTLAVGPISGTGLRQSIYYAKGIAGGANSVTVTFSTKAAYPDIRILEYAGASTLDKTAGAAGNSATSNSGAATTTAANELIVGANTVATLTRSAGAGFTSRIITSRDGDIAEDQNANSAGTFSATAPLTSTGPWVMQMVTFK